MFFHFLMMAATLAGAASDDHVRHHFIDPGVPLKFLILEESAEESQEDSVFEAFFFVPVTVPFVFSRLAEGRLHYTKRQTSLNTIVSKDLLLNNLLYFSLHS